PVRGVVYATNTEARNEVRFSGPGVFSGSSVRGRLHESRITVLDAHGVRPRHLNAHIDYATIPSPPGVKEQSVATPTAMALSPDGATMYVAALGSNVVAVYDTATLEADDVPAAPTRRIAVPGGGPTGVVLDDARGRLYVLARFDDAVSVL